MSERLEKIKAKFRDSYDDDIAYLIQQAEHAEELEKENENLVFDIKHERHYRKLAEGKNERYKQALEEIKHIINVTPYREYTTNKIRHRLFDIATEALEQEK